MSIRRSLPALLAAVALAAAACGESDAVKAGPDDAVGMGSAEGAAEGTGPGTTEGREGMEPGTTNQPGTPANDTAPHRPGMPRQP